MQYDKPNLTLRAISFAVLVLTALAWSSSVLEASPDIVGVWEGPFEWPLVGTHLIHLPPSQQSPTPQILVLPSDGGGPIGAWVLNLEDDCLTMDHPGEDACFAQEPNPHNLFCGGHSLLPDGSALVVGGHTANHMGLNVAYRFDAGGTCLRRRSQ